MSENFESFGAILKVKTFSFLAHSSKNNKNLKNASTEVPTRAQDLSSDVSYVTIKAFLLT